VALFFVKRDEMLLLNIRHR